MNDESFMRYSRQLLLEPFTPEMQNRLAHQHVLIIGLGGLGCPAALYLAGAGIGTLIVADDDRVHLSNLPRQILFQTQHIGQLKTAAAKAQLQALNPACRVIERPSRLGGQSLMDNVAQADLVLDCTDNHASRLAINAACVSLNKPLVTASAIGFNGQMMVVTPPWSQGCYQCLWPEVTEPTVNCRNAGVLGPVVGMMGTWQALAALRLLTGISDTSASLVLFEGLRQHWQSLTLAKNRDCPVCGGAHAAVA